MIERRDFLRGAIAGLAATGLGSRVYAAATDKPIRAGVIGPGWYGKTDLYALCRVAPVEVVALADVDSQMLDAAAERAMGWASDHTRRSPRRYADYRQMLANHEFDVVLVDTPDHWHALPMIEAVKRGANVYCQKPISVDVVEGEAMLAAARKYDRVVQVGTQRRSTPHLQQAVDEIIKSGKLGEIGHVEICCYYHMRRHKRVPFSDPPAHFDYDMWSGPAPLREYMDNVHPRAWRHFMAYSNGIVGDMCIHMLDMVRWMLDLGWPQRIHSSGGIYVETDSAADTPDTQTATFEFPDYNVVWNHRSWGTPPDPAYPWAAFIYGEKGTLKASVDRWDFIPQGAGQAEQGKVLSELDKFPSDAAEPDLEPKTAPANRRHQQDLLAAIAEGRRPVADIEQGFISSACCILANMSMQLGRAVSYDHEKKVVVGDAEATKLLARPYRQPWEHPTPENV